MLDNGYVLKQCMIRIRWIRNIWLPISGSEFRNLASCIRIHNIWLTVYGSTDPQYLAYCILINGSTIFGFLYTNPRIRNIWLPVSRYRDPLYLASCIRIHGSTIFGFLYPDTRIRNIWLLVSGSTDPNSRGKISTSN